MTNLYFVGCPAPCTAFLLLPLLLLPLDRSFVFSELLGHPAGRKEKEVGPRGVVERWYKKISDGCRGGEMMEIGKSWISARRMGKEAMAMEI